MPFTDRGLAVFPNTIFGEGTPNSITINVVDEVGNPIPDAMVNMTYTSITGFIVPVLPEKLTDQTGSVSYRRTAKLFRRGRHDVTVSHPDYGTAELGNLPPGVSIVTLSAQPQKESRIVFPILGAVSPVVLIIGGILAYFLLKKRD